MVRAIAQSGLSGLKAASDDFDRAAAQVTRLARTLSSAETAAQVSLSPQARSAAGQDAPSASLGPEARSSGSVQDKDTGTLEGAMVDTRIAKYAFVANLRVLQTADEMASELTKVGQKR